MLRIEDLDLIASSDSTDGTVCFQDHLSERGIARAALVPGPSFPASSEAADRFGQGCTGYQDLWLRAPRELACVPGALAVRRSSYAYPLF